MNETKSMLASDEILFAKRVGNNYFTDLALDGSMILNLISSKYEVTGVWR
jgi:hypothetical protein